MIVNPRPTDTSAVPASAPGENWCRARSRHNRAVPSRDAGKGMTKVAKEANFYSHPLGHLAKFDWQPCQKKLATLPSDKMHLATSTIIRAAFILQMVRWSRWSLIPPDHPRQLRR